MSDSFIDSRPDQVPLFSDAQASLSSHVAQLPYLLEAFCHYLNEVIDKLCIWMNFWAAKRFAATGNQRVNRLIWKAVTQDEMYMLYVFISLLMVMGVMRKWYMGWVRYSGAVRKGLIEKAFFFFFHLSFSYGVGNLRKHHFRKCAKRAHSQEWKGK